MNKQELQSSVNHIETIHIDLYNLTENRWFRDNEKRLVKICEKNIQELKDNIKQEKKELKVYNAKLKAYERNVSKLEKALQSHDKVSKD